MKVWTKQDKLCLAVSIWEKFYNKQESLKREAEEICSCFQIDKGIIKEAKIIAKGNINGKKSTKQPKRAISSIGERTTG